MNLMKNNNLGENNTSGTTAIETGIKNCRYCFKKIEQMASVCHYCGRDQNRFSKNFNNIAVIIAIVMMFIAFAQLKEARQERIKAEEAKKIAVASAEENRELQENLKNYSATLVKLILFESSLRSRWGDE